MADARGAHGRRGGVCKAEGDAGEAGRGRGERGVAAQRDGDRGDRHEWGDGEQEQQAQRGAERDLVAMAYDGDAAERLASVVQAREGVVAQQAGEHGQRGGVPDEEERVHGGEGGGARGLEREEQREEQRGEMVGEERGDEGDGEQVGKRGAELAREEGGGRGVREEAVADHGGEGAAPGGGEGGIARGGRGE